MKYSLFKKKVMKSNVEKARKVKLYETEELLPIEECYLVHKLGYFSKLDIRIVPDCLEKDVYIILDDKYKHLYRPECIYFTIDENGNFDKVGITISSKMRISYFTILYKNTYIISKLISNPIFKKFYKEDLNSNKYVKITDIIEPFIKNIKEVGNRYDSNFPESFLNSLKRDNIPITYRRLYGKRNTWGVEIETISGYLPHHINNLGHFMSVFDGSLRHKDDNRAYGVEYVTSVLKGDQGLKELKFLTTELAKRCIINYQCANHFHIGVNNFTKENVILMYYLYCKLEKEIFSMLPLHRRTNEYCRSLQSINGLNIDNISPKCINRSYYLDLYYNEIVKIMTQGHGVGTKVGSILVSRLSDHPKGHKCGYDKSTARYCWVNFVPLIFNTRNNKDARTIEFRMPSATLSYFKNKMWLLISIGLVDIVENYKDFLYANKDIALEQVINIVYPIGASRIVEFIKQRKQLYSSTTIDENTIAELNDYLDNEIDEDLSLKNL